MALCDTVLSVVDFGEYFWLHSVIYDRPILTRRRRLKLLALKAPMKQTKNDVLRVLLYYTILVAVHMHSKVSRA